MPNPVRHFLSVNHISDRFAREATRYPYKASKCPVEREYKFDGQGGYAPKSGPIPRIAWVGAVAVLGFLYWMFRTGAAVGF